MVDQRQVYSPVPSPIEPSILSLDAPSGEAMLTILMIPRVVGLSSARVTVYMQDPSPTRK